MGRQEPEKVYNNAINKVKALEKSLRIRRSSTRKAVASVVVVRAG